MQRWNQTTCNHPTDYRFRQHFFSSKYNINMRIYLLLCFTPYQFGLVGWLGWIPIWAKAIVHPALPLTRHYPYLQAIFDQLRNRSGLHPDSSLVHVLEKLNTRTLKQAKIQQKTEVNPVFAFPHDPGKPPVNHPQWKAFYLHRTQGISARYLIFKIQTCFPSTSLVLPINNLISATIMFCSMLREEYCFCPHLIFITLYV